MRTSDLEVFLAKDPLSDLTRKARRNVLLTGFVSIVVAKAHLVPKKIALLGIEFSEPQQEVFFYTLAGLMVYFIAQFSAYLLSDVTQRNIEGAKLFADANALDPTDKEKEKQSFLDAFADGELRVAAMRQYFWRGTIDVFFPYALAIYVLWAIWTTLA
jgi:hypothetical protein